MLVRQLIHRTHWVRSRTVGWALPSSGPAAPSLSLARRRPPPLASSSPLARSDPPLRTCAVLIRSLKLLAFFKMNFEAKCSRSKIRSVCLFSDSGGGGGRLLVFFRHKTFLLLFYIIHSSMFFCCKTTFLFLYRAQSIAVGGGRLTVASESGSWFGLLAVPAKTSISSGVTLSSGFLYFLRYSFDTLIHFFTTRLMRPFPLISIYLVLQIFSLYHVNLPCRSIYDNRPTARKTQTCFIHLSLWKIRFVLSNNRPFYVLLRLSFFFFPPIILKKILKMVTFLLLSYKFSLTYFIYIAFLMFCLSTNPLYNFYNIF